MHLDVTLKSSYLYFKADCHASNHRSARQRIDPDQFFVITEGKNVGPFEVPSPKEFASGSRKLMPELRWYLERFLSYPYHPETERAELLLDSLADWGRTAGEALFNHLDAQRILDRATDESYADLELRISSDDPRVLQWPWEAIRTRDAGVLSRTSQIKRQLNELRPPPPISGKLSRDRINILLVTARPMKNDVGYRSISRLLVEKVHGGSMPVTITVLRPPTLQQLRRHLRERKDHYHILHFDGHGSYGGPPTHDPRTAFDFKSAQGQLIFEDDKGEPDPHDAEVLAELLKECHVPVVVLNACQSAMVDDRAKDAFASVAAALQWSGVRSVVAMAYSLYVSGAQQFLPEFYERLFESGKVPEAARAGRQKMLERQERVCSRGKFKLEDWLVPVVYEQETFDFSFVQASTTATADADSIVPDEAKDSENPYGFIGRDNAILEMERAMHRAPAGILVHGLGGIGKTTLTQGFIRWLAKTDGLGKGCLWFSFQEIRSAESVINQMVSQLFGTNALTAGIEEKTEALATVLKENRFLVVWDNFEVVTGIEGTTLTPSLPVEDRELLRRFLKQLRGGKTKVLITSRSNEEWLAPADCFRMGLSGLQGEERWEYCETIIRDFGQSIDRNDKQWKDLSIFWTAIHWQCESFLPSLQAGKLRLS